MTPRFLPCGLSIVLLVSVQACASFDLSPETIDGSGRLSEATYAFTGITGVQFDTIGDLEIQLGDTEELRIEADDNLLHYFEAEQDGNTLRISTNWRDSHPRPSRTVRYTLTVKELEFIGLASTGYVHAPLLTADRFEIRVASTGYVLVDRIEADALDVRIDSTGDVRIDGGVVDSLDLRINSLGNYDGESLRSARATVRLSSIGDARLWAEESLDATLRGAGSVFYRGDPKVSENHNHAGRVRRIQ